MNDLAVSRLVLEADAETILVIDAACLNYIIDLGSDCFLLFCSFFRRIYVRRLSNKKKEKGHAASNHPVWLAVQGWCVVACYVLVVGLHSFNVCFFVGGSEFAWIVV